MCIAKSRPTYWLSLLAVLVVAAPPSAHAQRPNPERANPKANDVATGDFILRTYEVGDLVVNVPDYGAPGAPGGATSAPMNYGGGGGGMGGGGFGGGGVGVPVVGGAGAMPAGQAPDPMQITFDSLIDAVTSVVAPHTWGVNGTGEGVVQSVGAALAVWQGKLTEVHEQIAAFLDMLRQGSAKRRTLSIDARWLMLDSQDLAKLADFSADERKVDRKLLETLTRRPTSMRGMTHCFSGQLVYLISGTRRNVVSGYIPVVGSLERPEEAQLVDLSDRARIVFTQFSGEGGGGTVVSDRSVGYQPIIEKPNFGVLLEIRPTVMQGEDVAVVDLKSTVTFPGQPTSDAAQSSAFDPAMATPRVDRLAVEMQELATTLRLPLGEPVLVGGMTYLTPSLKQHDGGPAESADAEGESHDNPQLYLVLEIR